MEFLRRRVIPQIQFEATRHIPRLIEVSAESVYDMGIVVTILPEPLDTPGNLWSQGLGGSSNVVSHTGLMTLVHPSAFNMGTQLIEIIHRSFVAGVMVVRVIHHQHRRMPRLLDRGQLFGEGRNRRHAARIHPGLKNKLLKLRSLFCRTDRHVLDGIVVVEIDGEFGNLVLLLQGSPGGVVVLGTDQHVGIASRLRTGSKHHGLSAGGWNASLEMSGMSVGLFQDITRNGITT